jgi:hypothetical protein
MIFNQRNAKFRGRPVSCKQRASMPPAWSDEETDEPLLADHRNYYKVEKWTKAGRVERMLYRRQQSRTRSVGL